MKRKLFVLTVIFALLTVSGVLSVIDCFADSPQIINYQGRLTDTGDNPLTDSYYFTFRLWSHKTSVEAQYYEWAESHGPVTVTDGLFNVILGSVNTDTLGAVFNTNSSLYMEIELEGETLSPRVEMGSAGYALEAIPSGVIVMWSGQTDTIPSGWALCDGTPPTPNLKDRFILGVTGESVAQVGDCGPDGSVSEIDSTIQGSGNDIYTETSSLGRHSGVRNDYKNTNPATPGRVNYMPPYYALAFIIKL